MAHMVCGYPNFSESEDIFNTLAQYAQYIEVQFPFSDPTADGVIIQKANKQAIEKGSSTEKCFQFLEKMNKQNTYQCKICIMTYANVVFNYGVEKFLEKSGKLGIYGIIIPDLPHDQSIFCNFSKYAKKNNIHIIHVVSPSTSCKRLKSISPKSSGCVYAISNNMTTGTKGKFEKDFYKYVQKLKSIFHVSIGVGFGISNIDDISKVNSVADFSIVGSALIERYNSEGVQGIHNFFIES